MRSIQSSSAVPETLLHEITLENAPILQRKKTDHFKKIV